MKEFHSDFKFKSPFLPIVIFSKLMDWCASFSLKTSVIASGIPEKAKLHLKHRSSFHPRAYFLATKHTFMSKHITLKWTCLKWSTLKDLRVIPIFYSIQCCRTLCMFLKTTLYLYDAALFNQYSCFSVSDKIICVIFVLLQRAPAHPRPHFRSIPPCERW